MAVRSGLDILLSTDFEKIKHKRVALLCNQASVTADLLHAVDVFVKAHREGQISLKALVGPQHGLWGYTQDNMIEWQGYVDKRTGIPVYSLYGENRKPTHQMLQDLDALVIDLQDVGAKYYTFIWTMALCMEACEAKGIEVMVLDRPNPLAGREIEGPYLNENYRSFVGLHSLAVRHGMTIGEIACYFKGKYYHGCELNVLRMTDWRREMYFEDTGLSWAMPSPNMPSPETAMVYPGMCLLEATNISEGRGTTRPFEIFGASWMNGWDFANALAKYGLPGVIFRPLEFQPTFHKYQDEICGGCYIHVTDRRLFKPFLTGVAIVREAFCSYPEKFRWKQPPYEYEYEKLPFDILAGNDWLRRMIEEECSLNEMKAKWNTEKELFIGKRRESLLY